MNIAKDSKKNSKVKYLFKKYLSMYAFSNYSTNVKK
jgi:hypothetical protein